MTLIDEKLPADPLQSEVVLHVRRHVRRAVRAGKATADDLALLFGLASEEGEALKLERALGCPSPLAAAAEIIAAARKPAAAVISLGHDADHIARCHVWLRKRKADEQAFRDIVATDLETLLVLSKARDLATARTFEAGAGEGAIPILIEGETGTGKEILAQAIHEIWSRDAEGCSRFHVVQVSGLPPDLINDELFGHVRGAYTGAQGDREGRLEAADRGTLLIDEVGDLPPEAQVRMLRFLQDQKLSRAGENKERSVRVRIIAATWHDLEQDVAQGRFRRDLLHRLRGERLRLPALRTRAGTFTEVVPEMLQRMGHQAQPPITRAARDALALYGWPGNLRELRAVLQVAMSSAAGDTIRLEDLPAHLQRTYLNLPLFRRAPGFLCDEVDGQPLTENLVAWRIEQVARSMDSLDPPTGAADASALHAFLVSIPDRSEEHQEVVRQLEESIRLTREQSRLTFVEGLWGKIRVADLPPHVQGGIEQELVRVHAQRDAVVTRARDLSATAILKDNAWCALLAQIRELPMFSDKDHVQLLQGFVPLLRIVTSASPEALDKIKQFFRDGGIRKMQDAIQREATKLLEVGPDDDTNDRASSDQQYKRSRKRIAYSREQWMDIVARYPTKAEASKQLDMDAKTITTHLKKHGIEACWGRPQKPARADGS